MDSEQGKELGMVVRGSLSGGLTMRLSESAEIEEIRAGNFVVIDGDRQRFFGMITDVALSTTDNRLQIDPPGILSNVDNLLRTILPGVNAYADVSLRPMLMLEKGKTGEVSRDDLRPVKTIPAHFCAVHQASDADVATIFGDESYGDGKFYHIGSPLDMEETPVCIDLERLVERSSGIFGKSGTGKTFLTRLCLCGILRARKAVNLIFDMHSEYGGSGTMEGGSGSVRGLKAYFPAQVALFTLDPESARRRGVTTDFDVRIPYDQIEPEDILLLADELNLTATAAETTYSLKRKFGKPWMRKFLALEGSEISDLAKDTGGNTAALEALYRRLGYLADRCKNFLVESLPSESDDAVDAILMRLNQKTSVVLEFGRETSTLSYMLVANILTRRIHHDYTRRMEASMGDKSAQPTPLVITIEEAHKFLAPHLANQTTFGIIARELRKFNVTLLIVDQRPSGIDNEVMSQIGTRVTCLLNDDKDIDAVLTGVAGARELRGVLAGLDSKQQALILGHAVPMPVVIKTRTYDDEAFFKAMRNPDTFRTSTHSNSTYANEAERRQKQLDDDFG